MNKGLKDKILKLYQEGKNYIDICKLLNCSKGTVSYHLNRLKEEERHKKKLVIQGIILEDIKSELDLLDKYENIISKRDLNKIMKIKFPKILSRFKSNTPEYYRDRRKNIKKKLIDYKGGKCEKCGYDKCTRALQFHHLDPKQKDFTISANIKSLTLDKIKKEIDKCILVCANCHAEIHDEIMSGLVMEAERSAKSLE